MTNKTINLSFLLLALLTYKAQAQTCSNLSAGAQRVYNTLQALGYQVQCGKMEFPPNPTQGCQTEYFANPSTCYGVIHLPGRNGEALSSIFHLDNDEAVLFLGKTPPKSHYFGFQSYVYSRINPLVTPSPSARVDIFAGVGPAINQRNITGLKAKPNDLNEVFSDTSAIISSSSKISSNDIVTKALPTYFKSKPGIIEAFLADQMSNLEKLPVDLIKFGRNYSADALMGILRLTPFNNPSTRTFDSASLEYMANHQVLIFRISPLVPRTADPIANFYKLSEVPMPDRNVEGDLSGEEQLLISKGISNPKASLQQLSQNIITAKAAQGYRLVSTIDQSNGVYAGATIEGRYCLGMFEYFVQQGLSTGNPNLPFSAPKCAGDSTDAAYLGVANLELRLKTGREIFATGFSHAKSGIATYSGLALQSPVGDSVTHIEQTGSSSPFSSGLSKVEIDHTFVTPIRESCLGVELNCIAAPLDQNLFVAERSYLNPKTGTKPAYSDLIYPLLLVFEK